MKKSAVVKDLSSSIDFLLEKAGPVIQYRLRKEILGDISPGEEEKLLESIYQYPLFRLLKTYVKPNGYIGSGMHSWGNWRGAVLHETPLQDGECAARLLSYYRVPKTHPIVAGFIDAMRDEDTLRKEFSYIPPEIPRFEHRFTGIHNGNCLGALLYTMQAMLGCGDDYDDLKDFQQISLQGFRCVNGLSCLEDITKVRTSAGRRYAYIEADTYFPNAYTLEMLAYTQSWRTPETVQMLADTFNHLNEIMRPDSQIQVKIHGKYTGPCFALSQPIKSFHPDRIDSILYRRLLTETAMLGVGERVEVLRESIANVKEALDKDGILRMNFSQPHNKRYSPQYIEYPGAYTDVRLEADYKNKYGLLCDLTFWAVEFLHLAAGENE